MINSDQHQFLSKRDTCLVCFVSIILKNIYIYKLWGGYGQMGWPQPPLAGHWGGFVLLFFFFKKKQKTKILNNINEAYETCVNC